MERKKLTLTIETGNAAFDDDNGSVELARLLREAAARIENGTTFGRLFDINGNSVGTFSWA